MGEAKRPKPRLTDAKARQVRDRVTELLTDASVHAQRIGAAAEQLGLTPDLLNGVGDQIYDAAISQLDIASKILERSQALADRLVDLGENRLHNQPLIRLDVKPRKIAHVRFVVHNASPEPATVEVTAQWDLGGRLDTRVGQPRLLGGRQTSVEIIIPTARVEIDHVYAGAAHTTLVFEGKRRVKLPRRDFEIWVSRG